MDTTWQLYPMAGSKYMVGRWSDVLCMWEYLCTDRQQITTHISSQAYFPDQKLAQAALDYWVHIYP